MEYQRVSLWTIIKRFLLGILFVALIIFLLLWFFPTKNSLNPLLQEVFRNNINSMKDAAETYFTNERMPSEVGDTVKITLGEMLDKHLLLPFTDKNGKSCSNTKSYVEITKTNTEYEMKVNLVCPTEEAFIIEHLGCTDRCIDCKKEAGKIEPKKITEYEFKKTVEKKEVTGYNCPAGYTKDPSNAKACYKNITKLDTKAATANKTTDTKDLVASTKTDVKSLVATKTIDTKELEDKSYINSIDLLENVNTDIKKVTTTTDTKAATANKTTDTKDLIVNNTYKYLYQKTTGKTYSKWSDWSEDKEYDPDNNNIVWGEQELVNNAKNGYLKRTITKTQTDTSKPIYNYTYDNLVGTYKQYVCSGYTYFRDSSTSTTYQTTDWVYSKTISSEKALTSTLTTKYEYAGMDYTRCSETCTLKPYYLYKVYTRSINAETRTKSQLSAVCNVEEKTINVYGMKKSFAGYETNKITSYEYVYYYHTKTRTVLSNGETLSKWSTSANDQSLLNAGYKYVRKEVDKTTTSCPSGYTKTNNNCVKTTTTYSCPNGYTKNGTNCTKEITSCPTGYTRSGNNCIKTTITYSCPTGYTRNGNKCEQKVKADSCPTGYTKNGTNCTKEIVSYSCPSGYTKNKNNVCEKVTTTYSCPSGYTKNGNSCTKTTTTYSCPTGYTRSGNNCTKEITAKEYKDAIAEYKTVNGLTYKWSTSKTLSGWTATGRTRTVEA